MPTTADQITKIREYLLANGQQELAGHLDGMEQEITHLRNLQPQNDPERTTAQEFQDEHSEEKSTDDVA